MSERQVAAFPVKLAAAAGPGMIALPASAGIRALAGSIAAPQALAVFW